MIVVEESGVVPTRETFWGLSGVEEALFYYFAAVAIVVFLAGVYGRFSRYTAGSNERIDRLDDLGSRILSTVRILLSNEGLFDRDRYAGLSHAFIMWGFLTLLIATTILAIDIDIWTTLLGQDSFWVGDFYLAYQFAVDAMGLLFVVGIGMALYRRYVVRTERLWGPHTAREDDLFIWTLFALGVGGFLLEGLRILATGYPSFEIVSFVGWATARTFEATGVTPTLAASLYWWAWWSHAILALMFVAWIPYAKPFHMLSSAATVLTRDPQSGRRLPNIPPEVDATSADSLDDFTWKELLDQDACTKCGRCSSACPAKAAGRSLDPRDVILDLKGYREDRDAGGEKQPIVADGGGVIDAETMNSCMGCLACVDACPVDIDHLNSFTRLNRQLTDQGDVDSGVQEIFGNLTQQGNAFGNPSRNRADWADPLPFDLTDAREQHVDYLWYVGDYPSYDERNRQVARALAKLFEAADVSVGILFEDERNDGNDVRRLGEEFLYLELAGHHVESFEACEFETLVCTDPHSYNTFKNEYPEIEFADFADDPLMPFDYDERWNADGDIEVCHWTQVVERLVTSGALDIPATLEDTVTYHDPCHLGRYNDEYEAPRALIEATGCELVEMPRNRDTSFCCGGGSGGVWMEFDDEPKPSEERLREALEDTTSTVDRFVVACPMCTTMYEDGRKTGGFENALEIVDVAELLVEAIEAAQPNRWASPNT